jgi:hypothetical protein
MGRDPANAFAVRQYISTVKPTSATCSAGAPYETGLVHPGQS